ncbi:MAG: GTPase HflX [Nannocystaceae bacterium]|nr:GTPase HflX [bacterium]
MRFHSKPIDEHAEVPLADEGYFEDLTTRWDARRTGARTAAAEGNACYILSVVRGRSFTAEAQLEEIKGLVEAQGDRIVGSESQRLHETDPRTFIGSGIAARVADAAAACGADMLVLDAELTPSQTRNLEDAVGLPICDREAVILNVFERHATTPRSRIQVEIAHLQYLRPRLRGIGLNMDQQAGGVMGSRGAGDTASELFARRMDGRLAELRRRLTRLEVSGRTQRQRRSNCARMVLVGYTNAGKTSLMNALTAADLSVRDRPFETLDTTSRCLSRHGGDVLLSDTVGFIRDLPERLYASFETTLAEVVEASLLVVVLDVSDPEYEQHLRATDVVLERLGSGDVPRFVVFNKADRCASLDREVLRRVAGNAPFGVVSTRGTRSVAKLRKRLLCVARARHRTREVFVPYTHAALTARIYAHCRVLRVTAVETGTQFVIEGHPRVVDDIASAAKRRTP